MNCHNKPFNAKLRFSAEVHDDQLWCNGLRLTLEYGMRLDGATKERLAEWLFPGAWYRDVSAVLNRLRVGTCSECGKRFLAHWQAKTCSAACARARVLSQREPPQPRELRTHCAICSTAITAQRSSKTYCSARCRQAGYRKWIA